MGSKIDSRLKFLRSQVNEELSELERLESFSVETLPSGLPRVRVLLQYAGDIGPVEAAGFELTSSAGDIATGHVALSDLDRVANLDSVVRIESSRAMTQELDVSMPETRAHLVHSGTPQRGGDGVVIGIIDSGIDINHLNFCRPDGTSRILYIWDQSLSPNAKESNPTGYSYGVEYSKADIDADLGGSPTVRHVDRSKRSGHGTHVAGIAAGDGSQAGNGRPPNTYVGVALNADIIVVTNVSGTLALGDSANTLDAVRYIFDMANALGRPVVVNISQGDNLGPHDGSSLLERGIDNLLGQPGQSLVKSAGNAADDRIHASGRVAPGAVVDLMFEVPNGDTATDTIDLWYAHQDRFSVTITPPGGGPSASVQPGSTTTPAIVLSNGNEVFIDSELDDPANHDNRIFVQLKRGSHSTIQAGTWTLSITGDTVVRGKFDAWIERGQVVPSFLPPYENRQGTVSIPGTSSEVITVGSYITRGVNAGQLSDFSSRGTTRDGRLKPEITAPGERIISARADGVLDGSGHYHAIRGTSMAAPHVTGAVALMLQANPSLNQRQLRDFLIKAARSDVQTGTTPNNDWGHGKLDVDAAVRRCASPGGASGTISSQKNMNAP